MFSTLSEKIALKIRLSLCEKNNWMMLQEKEKKMSYIGNVYTSLNVAEGFNRTISSKGTDSLKWIGLKQ